MITMEQVDEFRKRTNSSYEDAKYYLERNNGNVLDAIIDFERSKTEGPGNVMDTTTMPTVSRMAGLSRTTGRGFPTYCREVLTPGSLLRTANRSCSISRNLPPVSVPLWFLVVVLFVFFILLGYRVSIRDVKSQNIDVDAFSAIYPRR